MSAPKFVPKSVPVDYTKYEALYKAAHVIVQTPAIRQWLEQNDPRALAQVKHAIEIADRE